MYLFSIQKERYGIVAFDKSDPFDYIITLQVRKNPDRLRSITMRGGARFA